MNNDPEHRYPSPLREDLPPMDGVYHVTWVSARMARTMQQLARHPETTKDTALKVRNAVLHDLQNFESGYDTVRRSSLLTATGEQVVASTASWVASIAHRP